MTYDVPLWADKRSYDDGFDDGLDTMVERIRAALKVRCGRDTITRGKCGMNKGHIGGCAPIAATITVTKERLEEILSA